MIRGIWDRETAAAILIAAILPFAVAWLLAEGWLAVTRLLFFMLSIAIWQLIFMLLRAQPPSLAGLVTALSVAILSPEDLGFVPLILGISFGIVFGELAFGGWGRNLLNPATITLAFLGFGFPAAPWPDLPVQLGWAALPAALIGVATGVMSLRLLVGAGLVFLAADWLDHGIAEIWIATAVVLVLLVCDPVTSAVTPGGRWMNGLLFGGLVVLFHQTWETAAPVQLAVSAALLTSLSAPLLDEIAMSAWLALRRRRLG